MIRKIALALVVLIAALLLYATTRPGDTYVERSITIQAPPEKIYPHINDFHRWSAWSPYEHIDPAMRRTHSGSPSGKGAVYAWEGNSEVGTGRMEIVDTTDPTMVQIRLDFTAPIEAHNVATFHIEPEGNATRVTWAMDGRTPYLGKLMGIFVNMDAMIGGAFAEGLAKLKTIAEKP